MTCLDFAPPGQRRPNAAQATAPCVEGLDRPTAMALEWLDSLPPQALLSLGAPERDASRDRPD
jgi:hypothetical protein